MSCPPQQLRQRESESQCDMRFHQWKSALIYSRTMTGNTVTSHRYADIIQTSVALQIIQFGVMPYRVRILMKAVYRLFGNRVIFRGGFFT